MVRLEFKLVNRHVPKVYSNKTCSLMPEIRCVEIRVPARYFQNFQESPSNFPGFCCDCSFGWVNEQQTLVETNSPSPS